MYLKKFLNNNNNNLQICMIYKAFILQFVKLLYNDIFGKQFEVSL